MIIFSFLTSFWGVWAVAGIYGSLLGGVDLVVVGDFAKFIILHFVDCSPDVILCVLDTYR